MHDNCQIIFYFWQQGSQKSHRFTEASYVSQESRGFPPLIVLFHIKYRSEIEREHLQQTTAVEHHLQKRGIAPVDALAFHQFVVLAPQNDVSHVLEIEPKARTSGVEALSPALELECIDIVEHFYGLGINMLAGPENGPLVVVQVNFGGEDVLV